MADNIPKDTAQQRTYRAFEALVSGEDGSLDLPQAALLIARIEYPDLDIARYLERLDALAQRVRGVLALPPNHTSAALEPLPVIDALNQVLFDEEHFRGNEQDYANPDNSFLNKVLDDRKGIPITLSLIYIEVAKRVGIHIDGVGLPFHFVVKCQLPQVPIYIDPYGGGLLLSERDCRERIRQIAGKRLKMHPEWFVPVTHRQFLARMLNNLKRIYIDAEDYARMLSICDMIILLLPHAPTERRDRGIIHLQLKRYVRALHDLEAYVELAPQAEDHQEILGQIKSLRQIIAMMN